MIFRIGLLMVALFCAGQAYAVDASMRTSLQAFFDHGIAINGVQAELDKVIRWPETTGTIHWRMPHINGYPARVSLIAEQVKGKQSRRWYVPVQLHWWTQAVIATQDISAGDALILSAIKTKRADIAGHHGHWAQDAHRLVGMKVTRPIDAGQVIYSNSVRKLPLLRRGDRVTLLVQAGSIQVRAIGKVLRPAGLGDRVNVQNLSSKQVVQATILDRNTARVVGGAS